jgi:hypothetical protein
MPRYCKHCGVDAPNAGQCGEVKGTRHDFIESTTGKFSFFIPALCIPTDIAFLPLQ